MAKGQENANHHYIPRFYLKGFATEDHEEQIWVYDLGRRSPYLAHVKNMATIRGFYTSRHRGGSKSTKVEDLFTSLEQRAAPVIRELRKGVSGLSEGPRLELMNFVAALFTRVPSYREWANQVSVDFAKQLMREAFRRPGYVSALLAKDGTPPGEATEEQLREFFMDETAYTLEAHPNLTLATSVSSIPTVATSLMAMNWVFLRPQDGSIFLTSDNPFVAISPGSLPGEPIGLLRRDIEITVPLASDLCMVGTWEGPTGDHHVGKRVVLEANHRIMGHAQKYLFACQKDPRILEQFNRKPASGKANATR